MRQLYINGNIATVDENMSYVEAFAVENGLFIKTGSNEEILDLKEDGDIVVDLEGKTVMPGFNDAHLHILNWASYHGEDRAKIEELMQKISDLNLDIDQLKEQAKDIYNKLESMGIEFNEGFFTKLKNCFLSLFDFLR